MVFKMAPQLTQDCYPNQNIAMLRCESVNMVQENI